MNDFDDLNALDRFTDVFIRFIDRGFGLLQGDVNYLVAVIFVIDLTLLGLFWVLDHERDIIAKFIRKVLFVGAFAYIIGNFAFLSDALFQSFGGLGLKATSTIFDADALLRPGYIAGEGVTAAHPILVQIKESFSLGGLLTGALGINIIGLFLAWILIIVAFFILAIQLFVTLIEFKLTMLAGYVLVPFSLWNKSAFIAQGVIGHAFSSGIKLMVLAVIIGIGSTFFADFAGAFPPGEDIEFEDTLVVIIAAFALLALSIRVPAVAAGLVSGAPQLGAGTAVATVGGVALAGAAGAGLAVGAVRAGAGAAASAARAGSSVAGGSSTAFSLARSASGQSGIRGAAAGLGGVARAGVGSVRQGAASLGARLSGGVRESFQRGRHGAWTATGGAPLRAGQAAGGSASSTSGTPAWAQRMRRQHHLATGIHTTTATVGAGDQPMAPSRPPVGDDNR